MGIYQLCDQLLSQNNYIEERQLEYGQNFNYDGWDYIRNPIPEIPLGSLFNDGEIAVTKSNRFSYVPAHTHEFVEMNYIFKGSSHQLLNGQKRDLHAGELLLLDHSMVHRIGYSGQNDLTANILLRDAETVSKIISNTGRKSEVVSFLRQTAMPGKLGHSNYMIFDLNKHPAAKDLADLIIYKGLCRENNANLMNLLMTALVEELPSCLTVNYSDFTVRDQALEEIVLYINAHFSSVSLTELSQKFSYNPNYISNLIKAKTGKTFKELVERRRLDMAQNLIIKTDLPLEEINSMVGYQDPTSLYRIFKKYLNTSPALFRKKIRGK